MDDLYQTNYTQWLGVQKELLANGQFDQLDVPNLIEAMESRMGDEVKELESHLKILLLHLLKCHYQNTVLKDPWVADKVIHTWYPSIDNPRGRLKDLIENAPHLRGKIEKVMGKAYGKARKDAVKQMNRYIRLESSKLTDRSLPEECPWSFDRVMDEDWLPMPEDRGERVEGWVEGRGDCRE